MDPAYLCAAALVHEHYGEWAPRSWPCSSLRLRTVGGATSPPSSRPAAHKPAERRPVAAAEGICNDLQARARSVAERVVRALCVLCLVGAAGLPAPQPHRPVPKLITFQRKRANRRIVNEEEVVQLLKKYGDLEVRVSFRVWGAWAEGLGEQGGAAQKVRGPGGEPSPSACWAEGLGHCAWTGRLGRPPGRAVMQRHPCKCCMRRGAVPGGLARPAWLLHACHAARVQIVEYNSTSSLYQQLLQMRRTGVYVSVHTSNLANAPLLQGGSAVVEMLHVSAYGVYGLRAGGLRHASVWQRFGRPGVGGRVAARKGRQQRARRRHRVAPRAWEEPRGEEKPMAPACFWPTRAEELALERAGHELPGPNLHDVSVLLRFACVTGQRGSAAGRRRCALGRLFGSIGGAGAQLQQGLAWGDRVPTSQGRHPPLCLARALPQPNHLPQPSGPGQVSGGGWGGFPAAGPARAALGRTDAGGQGGPSPANARAPCVSLPTITALERSCRRVDDWRFVGGGKGGLGRWR